MWYFGYVTPKQFIERLGKQLKHLKDVPPYRKGYYKDEVWLLVPIQGDSRFVVRASAKNIDFGDGLLIVLDLAEVVFSPKAPKPTVKHSADLYTIIWRPYDRKLLRETCQKLTLMIYNHLVEIETVTASQFFDIAFDDNDITN